MSRTMRSAPLIVGEGTLINKKDILRALETLDYVAYEYRVDNELISSGKAYLARIFQSEDSATILANGYLFANVLSFDYLRFYTRNKRTVFELSAGSALLKLVPEKDPSRPPCKYAQPPTNDEVYGEGTYVILDEENFEDEGL